MATSKFQQGSGKYKCFLCGKLTRDTGRGEVGLEMCFRCLLVCNLQNAENDYGKDSEQAAQEREELAIYDKAAA